MRRLLFAALMTLAACASSRDEPGGEARAASTAVASAPAIDTAGPAIAPAAASVTATSPSVEPAKDAVEPGDRIYAKGRFVWIQPMPGARGWLGYLTLGGSVRLYEGSAEKAKTEGPGCEAWYRVEPRGYVCLGPETTLDPNDPVYKALANHAGDGTSSNPYQYGESTGTPRYFTLPSRLVQQRTEADLERHLVGMERLRSSLAKGDADAVDPLYRGIDPASAKVPFPSLPPMPALVHENRNKVIQGSTVAWAREYDDEDGRTWLYTSDHALVPKDRVKPYPKSEFRGVHLDATTRLPIAFFRAKDRPKYRLEGDRFLDTGQSFARLSWVMLTGESKKVDAQTYVETREAGVWVLEKDAAIVRQATLLPFEGDELAGERRTWLDISVMGGTLVAYEGDRAVFTTLIAPGRGGIPFPGKDAVSTASTPTGTFRIDGKFRWATMVSSSDSDIVHSEVQWVQNFHGPHALHGAYWHDGWGELKSGGCVNLSPSDSKWVFDFTEPRLPKDWHGLRSVKDFGPSTRVVVRR